MTPALAATLPLLWIVAIVIIAHYALNGRKWTVAIALTALAGFILASTPYATDLRKALHVGSEGTQVVSDVTGGGS